MVHPLSPTATFWAVVHAYAGMRTSSMGLRSSIAAPPREFKQAYKIEKRYFKDCMYMFACNMFMNDADSRLFLDERDHRRSRLSLSLGGTSFHFFQLPIATPARHCIPLFQPSKSSSEVLQVKYGAFNALEVHQKELCAQLPRPGVQPQALGASSCLALTSASQRDGVLRTCRRIASSQSTANREQ